MVTERVQGGTFGTIVCLPGNCLSLFVDGVPLIHTTANDFLCEQFRLGAARLDAAWAAETKCCQEDACNRPVWKGVPQQEIGYITGEEHGDLSGTDWHAAADALALAMQRFEKLRMQKKQMRAKKQEKTFDFFGVGKGKEGEKKEKDDGVVELGNE